MPYSSTHTVCRRGNRLLHSINEPHRVASPASSRPFRDHRPPASFVQLLLTSHHQRGGSRPVTVRGRYATSDPSPTSVTLSIRDYGHQTQRSRIVVVQATSSSTWSAGIRDAERAPSRDERTSTRDRVRWTLTSRGPSRDRRPKFSMREPQFGMTKPPVGCVLDHVEHQRRTSRRYTTFTRVMMSLDRYPDSPAIGESVRHGCSVTGAECERPCLRTASVIDQGGGRRAPRSPNGAMVTRPRDRGDQDWRDQWGQSRPGS